MPWQLLVLISVTTYAASITVQRVILKDNKCDAVAYSIFFQLIVGCLLLLYATFNGFNMPNIMQHPLNYLYMTILYGAGNILMYKSLQHIDASQFTILFSTRTFWTIAIAILFLSESFSIEQILGTLLIISGVILASWQGKRISLSKGEQWALISAICYGLAFANDAFLLQSVDAASYTAISFLIPPILLWTISPKITSKIQQLTSPKVLKKIILIAIIYAVSILALNYAYQIGKNSAQIAPLNQTSTLLTVLFGIIILQERDSMFKKIAASIIACIGIILLI